MVCMICNKLVQPLSERLQSVFEDGSGEVTIQFLYGSRKDSGKFSGHIHQNCFEKIQERFLEK